MSLTARTMFEHLWSPLLDQDDDAERFAHDAEQRDGRRDAQHEDLKDLLRLVVASNLHDDLAGLGFVHGSFVFITLVPTAV